MTKVMTVSAYGYSDCNLIMTIIMWHFAGFKYMCYTREHDHGRSTCEVRSDTQFQSYA